MDQLDPDLGRPLELRVLTGPNLYFARPAIKLTLDASGVLSAEPGDVVAWQRALRVRNPTVGLPDSPARANAAAELAAAVVRRAAAPSPPGSRRWPARRRPHGGCRFPVPAPRHRRALRRSRRRAFASITQYGIDPVVALGESRRRWPVTILARRSARCVRASP